MTMTLVSFCNTCMKATVGKVDTVVDTVDAAMLRYWCGNLYKRIIEEARCFGAFEGFLNSYLQYECA